MENDGNFLTRSVCLTLFFIKIIFIRFLINEVRIIAYGIANVLQCHTLFLSHKLTKKKLLRWLGLSCLRDASKSANNHMSLLDETVSFLSSFMIFHSTFTNGKTEFNRNAWFLKTVPLLGSFLRCLQWDFFN